MNSLILSMQAEEPIILPLAYNRILQGALYSLWRRTLPELHNNGLRSGNLQYRPFTFGQLKGSGNVHGKQISFHGSLSLEVRSPESNVIESLASAAADAGQILLGHSYVSVSGLRCADQLLFPSNMRVRMNSPVVAYLTEENGKTHYFAPDDPMFVSCLLMNLQTKMNALGRTVPETLSFSIAEGYSFRKCVTLFKDTYITGYWGDYNLQTDPESAAVLYYAGIGQRNSQGFGLFDIIQQGE